MKPSMICLGIAAALACASASAQNATSSISDNTLAQEQGLTQLSNGFYARTTPTSVHYLAVNPAGMHALLQKLFEEKAKQPQTAARNATVSTPSVLDRLIDQLSRPQTQASLTGDCTGAGGTGYPMLSTTATSSGGDAAASQAVLTRDLVSPVTQTRNEAIAEVEDPKGDPTGISHQRSVTYGSTPASARASGSGCRAYSSATVTCPGHTSYAIASYAQSQNTGAICVL